MIINKLNRFIFLSIFLCSGLLSSCDSKEYSDEYTMVMDVLNNTNKKYNDLEYFQYTETITKKRGKKDDNIEITKMIYKYDLNNNIIYYSSLKDNKVILESYKAFINSEYYTINKTDKKYKIYKGHEGEFKWVNYDLCSYLFKSDDAISNYFLLKDNYNEYNCNHKKKGYIESSGSLKKDDINFKISFKIEDYILTEYKRIEDYGNEGDINSYIQIKEVNMEFNEEELIIPSLNKYKDVTMEDNIIWS